MKLSSYETVPRLLPLLCTAVEIPVDLCLVSLCSFRKLERIDNLDANRPQVIHVAHRQDQCMYLRGGCQQRIYGGEWTLRIQAAPFFCDFPGDRQNSVCEVPEEARQP